METKYCHKCEKTKPLTEFYKSTRGGCRSCVREYQNRWYRENRAVEKEVLPDDIRRCGRCGEEKSVDEFYRDKSNVSGYHHYCKTCSDSFKRRRSKKTKPKEIFPDGHKRCSKCKKVLPYSEFYRLSKSKDGHKGSCKGCDREYKRSELGKQAARNYASRPEVRAKRNARKRERRQNDEEYRAKEKRYRQEYQKRDYVVEKSRIANARRRAIPENREKAREETRQWRQDNRERVREQNRIKKLRKKGAEGNHTPIQWEELIELCQGKCLACGTNGKMTRDHIIPFIKGGTDYIDNIQPLCKPCNSVKHTDSTDYRPAYVKQWADGQR